MTDGIEGLRGPVEYEHGLNDPPQENDVGRAM